MKALRNPWGVERIESGMFEWVKGIQYPPEAAQYVVFEPDNKWIGSMMFYKEHNRWGAVNRCKYFNNRGEPNQRFFWCHMPNDPDQPQYGIYEAEYDDYDRWDE
jgi:hypothetical protein